MSWAPWSLFSSKTISENLPQEALELDQFQIDVHRRRGIRRLTLRVTAVDRARLTVPWHTPLRYCWDFVRSQEPWLRQEIEKWRKVSEWTDRRGLEGERYFFLGESYQLRRGWSPLKKNFLQWDQSAPNGPALWLHGPPDFEWQAPQVLGLIEKHFHHQAKIYLIARAHEWSLQRKLSVEKVRVRRVQSRWGSCSRSRRINLNQKLVGAPLWVIDSVIHHELAHLTHFNHSTEFWKLLAEWSPNHEAADRWLNEHQHKLF